MKLLNLILFVLLSCAVNAQASRDITDFVVEKANEKITFTWNTSKEPETNYFEIQHSSDGKDWQAVAIMFPFEDNTRDHSYKYIHKAQKQSNGYYRIRQIDVNKNDIFSEVKLIGAVATN